MRNVDRIIILYPGETSSERINRPQNYSLSRLLLLLHATDRVPIYFLNQSKRYERYGNIEFIHFTKPAFLRVLARCFGKRNTLIISQLHVYRRYALLLRRVLPGSRLLVRMGGVYYGRKFLESPTFQAQVDSELHYLRQVDMVLSTADGTAVDLYMEKVGVPREKYRKWMNGLPRLENARDFERQDQVVCISRLSPEKGVGYVLESFAQALPSLAKPHRLVIVGDGPELASLKEHARTLGITPAVEFVGESDDVEKYLYGSKLLLSALANNTVLEAIATRTPVVAVDLGEMTSLYGRFPNVHVVDYPPGGYGAIDPKYRTALVRDTAAKIAEILNNYPRFEPSETPSPIDLYGWDRRLRDELELYESLFDRAPRQEQASREGSVITHLTET
jgi:glycosyltransferase involved in cell wall biosynthesis